MNIFHLPDNENEKPSALCGLAFSAFYGENQKKDAYINSIWLFIFLHLSKRICYNVPEKTSLQDSRFLNLVNNMNRDYEKEYGRILR